MMVHPYLRIRSSLLAESKSGAQALREVRTIFGYFLGKFFLTVS